MTVMTLFSIKTYSKGFYFKSLVNWQKTVISVMEGRYSYGGKYDMENIYFSLFSQFFSIFLYIGKIVYI